MQLNHNRYITAIPTRYRKTTNFDKQCTTISEINHNWSSTLKYCTIEIVNLLEYYISAPRACWYRGAVVIVIE